MSAFVPHESATTNKKAGTFIPALLFQSIILTITVLEFSSRFLSAIHQGFLEKD